MKYCKIFYLRILYLLLIYSSSRILFYLFNTDYFDTDVFYSFLEGVRFDISSILYINIPLLILLLLPTNLREKKYYHKIVNYVFYIINIPFLLINNVDIEYFKFSQKRTTSDIFDYLSLGGGADAYTIIPQYLTDFPHVTIIIIIQIFLLLKIKYIPKEKIKNWSKAIALFLLSIGIFILGARGGTQLKPIKIIDAGTCSNTKNSVLVLNSPFCILHTFNEKGLKEHSFFSEEKANKTYPTIHHFKNGKFKNKNVVIIILESFSKEYVGYYNNNNGYTPFLDKLISESLVMENAYANGIKSIEALPAITASIPTLMNNPFITSSYANNNYKGLAEILKNEGYSTSFFHGGTRGTMGFYQFSKKAGFDKYFGKEDYNNEEDYDGTWGVYDGPFFNYFTDYLKTEKQPFISSIFSLSSHPPYSIPQGFENKFPKGKLEIHETIGYTDFVLKEFFENAKKEKWYKNTLFIITADHTSPQTNNKKYKNKVGRYSIPILYFMGDSSIKGSNSYITQQLDILPTTLDLLNYNNKFFSFGNSALDSNGWAISYLNNQYLLINKNGFLIDRNGGIQNYSDEKMTIKIEENENSSTLLKAIKQKYNNNLINNKITIYED